MLRNNQVRDIVKSRKFGIITLHCTILNLKFILSGVTEISKTVLSGTLRHR